MNDDDFKRLKTTLCGGNEESDQRYYVYGLFEKGEQYPFYIGKGQNARVFQHEAEYEEIYDSIINEPDFEQRKEKLSIKLKKISKAKEIEKVIIKWGLTEHEAYMCESALINLYQYMANGQTQKLEELTNAVNGHKSPLEKSNEKDTKARKVEDFLHECAPEQIDISTGKEGKSIIEAPVIFIRINQLYKSGMSDEELREITRGCWNIGDKIYEYIKEYNRRQQETDEPQMKPIYIAGIYHQFVKCVYKVTNIIGDDDFKESNNDKPQKDDYIKRSGQEMQLSLEWLEYTSRSFEAFERSIKEFQQKNVDCDVEKYFNGKDPLKHFEQWKKRKYFIVDEDKDGIKEQLIHKMITCTNDPSYLSSAQNPISRNFDIKVKSKNRTRSYTAPLRDKTWFLANHAKKETKQSKKKKS